ncbi:alpha/beta hydrolase [Mycetocola tolaasinivorans]|uniref:Alpha/beta hydrolase n=1 Tax=Mycetocola tolaasinivorans TaxID=76635 RepID=A0A3L7AD84_9MICO|nr:alpha/beta hydrolase [Mycetocola tolaasinivorans]RLP77975.1 alpha/beta hydrolase [Mycetocola tolaasinivorans]
MKKFLKVVLKVLGVIVAIIGLTLATTSIVNAVASSSEADRITPYGRFSTVDGKKLNIVTTGDGPETIVLLPGFGTSAPAIDFGPVTEKLSKTHRVVVVEPFGYGLSDQTDVPRTSENIVTEIHEALHQQGIDRFVLGGHSIAGIYSLNYVNKYPEDVTAFVGIDTSVPDQPGMDVAFPIDLMRAAKATGVVRAVSALDSDSLAKYAADYPEAAREQNTLIVNRNAMSNTYLDEMSRIGSNFADAKAKKLTFPADMPVLLFAQDPNKVNPNWLNLHEEQAALSTHGEVIPVDGDHYLHHTESALIAAETNRFLAELPVSE